MKAYVDSSVFLRLVLGAPHQLEEWSLLRAAFTSEIARVECLRTFEQARVLGEMTTREFARRRTTLLEYLEEVETIRLNRAVLDRASETFPAPIRTLDALHLASALLAAARYPALRFATHDVKLAAVAEAMGFHVIGAAT